MVCCECDVFKVNTCSFTLSFHPTSDQTSEKFLFVKNISDTPQALLLECPASQNFSLEYIIPHGHILPGKDIRIKITLKSKLQLRAYYDCIRVSCKKGCSIIIKLTASPSKSILGIPPEINLGTVPFGERATAKITLPAVEKKMPFVVISSSCNPDLTITPMKGMVSDNPVTIEFCYVPKAYITVSFPIHIYLPSLISWPYFVNVIADTKPGRLGELITSQYTNFEKDKPIKKEHRITRLPKSLPKEVSTEKDMSWSLHQTNRFLLEKDNDVCPHGLKNSSGKPWSYQENFKAKEQLRFMNEVEDIKKQLLTADNCRKDLFIDKNLIKKDDYYNYWNDDQNIMECNETVFYSFYPRKFTGRTMKFLHNDQPSAFVGKFQNPWFVRYTKLNKFIEVVRIICIQNRLLKRLAILKTLTKDKIQEIESSLTFFDA